MSRFKRAAFVAAVLCCSFRVVGCAPSELSPAECAGYAVLAADDSSRADLRWTEYLCDHLRRRTDGGERIVVSEPSEDLFTLTVGMDSLLDGDFCVRRGPQGVGITARDERGMLWLQYQLMKSLSVEDRRVEASDLPPATVSLRDTCGRFAFDFRGLYTPAALDADRAGILAADNVETVWGLWGHQLDRVLAGASEQVFATVGGVRYGGQFCFSAEETYRRIEAYVADNYGDGTAAPMRFVIAPADDPAACTCERCVAAGNTEHNAAPAVTQLLARLAKRFPRHAFFTLGYLSVSEPPAEPLPANTGVIVSAMSLPLMGGAFESPHGWTFARLLERWRGVTGTVYVWDYIQNFDDYLSPFPVLDLMAGRLRFYRDHGVAGIFLNGSGSDYVPFDDMRSYVLSALMLDPGQSPEELMRNYFTANYPRSGALLADYCARIEHIAAASVRPLDLYGGIRSAEMTWLDAGDFVLFYDALAERLPSARDAERRSLHRLLTSLSYTRLELARSHASGNAGLAVRDGNILVPRPAVNRWLAALEEHVGFAEMSGTDESHSAIDAYLREWRNRILPALGTPDVLLGAELTPVSRPDEQYRNLGVLTDGVRGMAFGYHYGWHISSTDLEVELPADVAARAGRLEISFLRLPRHRLQEPRAVEVYKDGTLHATLRPTADAAGRIVTFAAPVELSGAGRITLRALRAEGGRTKLAADEISLIP